MERRSIDEWLAESLRLTLFLRMGDQVQEQNWWQDLLNTDANDIKIQPKTGQRQELGPYEDDKWLNLSIQPDRIDWMLTPPAGMPATGQVPNIGKYLESIGKFSELMLRWLSLENCPSAARLALGAILLTRVADVGEGYRQLSAYLPFDIGTENASDFMYQINRFRPSASVDNVSINRLSKWSVSAIFWGKSKFFKGLASATYSPGPHVFSCRLELDVNTVSKPELELGRDDCQNLYREFVELGEEIVQKGDIP